MISRSLRRFNPLVHQVIWLALVVFELGLTGWLGWQNGLGRVDQAFYDYIISSHPRTPRKDIVIVAIDERSLAFLGPYPWRRNLHAELIRRVTEDHPYAIGLSLILSTPDLQYPHHDLDLAEAIHDSQNTVLPIRIEGHAKGPVIKTLPLPMFLQAAVAVGGLRIKGDSDGIVRSLSLRDEIEGVSQDSFVIQLLRIGGTYEAIERFPGLRDSIDRIVLDQRDWKVQIPFAGSPGTIQRVSYVDILHNQISPGFFRDKYVLIGTTALGLGGDAYPTPVSIDGQPMPAVEIVASTMDALLQGVTIDAVSSLGNALFNLLPVASLLLSFIWLSPRRALLFCLLLIVITIGSSYLMIRVGGYWYPPSAALLGLVVAYSLRGWHRLEVALAYLTEEFERLNQESKIYHFFDHSFGDALDQKIAALSHAAKHLRDLQRLIMDSIDSLPDAMLVTDTHGAIVLMNRSATEFFQVDSADSLYGEKLINLLSTIQPLADKAIIFDPDKAIPWVQSVEGVEAIDSRGNELLVKSVPCSSSSNLQVGWIVSLVNITAIRHAERKRDEVLRFLSHDMRAPQTSILALLDLYQSDRDIMTETELFDRIGKCAIKTLNLADDFIQLDRAESHQYHFEEADLSQLMLDAIDDCWAQAQAKNVQIHNDIPGEPALIRADRVLLTRAIYNLLSNAIKYGPEKGEVWCSLKEWHINQQRFWKLSVRDQGPGIPEVNQPFVFKRYRRFHTATQPSVEGTGLGLAFVKTVLTQHGGKVDFTNIPGMGCEFCMYVQIAESAYTDDNPD